MKKDQTELFKDLGAAVEQTVEDIRGAEENYFHILQPTMANFPWIVGFNKKLQNYADQNAIAFEFADRLSKAKDFQDLARIETEFILTCLQYFGEQTKDFAEGYSKSCGRFGQRAFL